MEADPSLQQKFYEMLMDSQWWSAQAIRDHQFGQLGQLLRHARLNVPFYADRLDPVVDSAGGVDFDRWTDIPVMTRQDLQQHRDAMQALAVLPGHGETAVFRSSRSSGIGVRRRPIGTSGPGACRIAAQDSWGRCNGACGSWRRSASGFRDSLCAEGRRRPG